MFKLQIIIGLIFITHFCSAQSKQDYVWVTGYDLSSEDGVEVITGNFNSDNFKWELTEKPMGSFAMNATICDREGRLLLYFNGCMIANGQNQLVENGDSINGGEFQDQFWNNCIEYGYPGSQDAMILPDPGNEAGYYIFHKKILVNPQGRNRLELNYSYVDELVTSNDAGIATIKNKVFYENVESMGRYFSAIADDSQSGYWIIQPLVEDSIFLTFYLDDTGIDYRGEQNTLQFFDAFRSSASGTSKFSPDGTKYAIYNYYDQLHLYDFDRSTGLFSNHQKIEIFPDSTIDRDAIRFGSVEWSPSSRFVYCASSLELHQVDTWEGDPQDGVRHIATYEEYLDPFQTQIHLQALAPDCKIYIVSGNSTRSYHVIKKPNELGTGCNFEQNGIKLPWDAAGQCFPNFPRFRVDEEEKCDPTITSVFGDAVYYRKELEVYPSPSVGPITVVIPDDWTKGRLVVLDVQGQIMLQENLINAIQKKRLDLSDLPAGHYNVELYPEQTTERIFYGKQIVLVK